MSITINPLQRVLIEKTGYDNGFEHVLPASDAWVTLASARHPAQALVLPLADGFELRLKNAPPALMSELLRNITFEVQDDGAWHAPTLTDLGILLRRAANLSQALPDQPEQDYQKEVAQALGYMPTTSRDTETERLVRQRIGQARYRDALLAYSGGACAVTGITVTEALRASHTKPWAECIDDGERLDVFNGFLLVANLDALFDRFLISFDDAGHLLLSPHLSEDDLHALGIHQTMTLRWLTNAHRYYLHWHRERFWCGGESNTQNSPL